MKRCYFVAILLSLCLFVACSQPQKDKTQQLSKQTVKAVQTKPTAPKTKRPVPIYGYRFRITGDFNGDGIIDTLTEHYYSDITHQETNKFFKVDSNNYDKELELMHNQRPYLFLSCSNKQVKPLQITEAGHACFGLAFLKNEGDLNGDGTDEISVVVNWADWSNINSCMVYTYRRGKWEPVYSFMMWDWLLPDLPGTVNQLGIAGRDKILVDIPSNSSTDSAFYNFKGLIKKVANNKIRIIHMSDDASLDTTMVDVRHWRKKL